MTNSFTNKIETIKSEYTPLETTQRLNEMIEEINTITVNAANPSLSNLNSEGEARFNAKANNNEVVHITGNETINGTKEFTSDIKLTRNTSPNLLITDNAMDWSQTPEAGSNVGNVSFLDSKNVYVASIHPYMNANGNRYLSFIVKNKTNTTSGAMNIGYNANDVFYSYCTASDAVNSIVTTTGIKKAANGYLKLGNGIILQWGQATFENSGTVITFPIAFTNTNFSIAFGAYGNTTDFAVGAIVTARTATNFTAHGYKQNGTIGWYNFWFAIGY